GPARIAAWLAQPCVIVESLRCAHRHLRQKRLAHLRQCVECISGNFARCVASARVILAGEIEEILRGIFERSSYVVITERHAHEVRVPIKKLRVGPSGDKVLVLQNAGGRLDDVLLETILGEELRNFALLLRGSSRRRGKNRNERKGYSDAAQVVHRSSRHSARRCTLTYWHADRKSPSSTWAGAQLLPR